MELGKEAGEFGPGGVCGEGWLGGSLRAGWGEIMGRMGNERVVFGDKLVGKWEWVEQ